MSEQSHIDVNDADDYSSDINLLDNPTEIIAYILTFVDVVDRFGVAQCCKRLLEIIHCHIGYGIICVRSSESCSRLSGSPLLKNTKISFQKFKEATDADLALLAGVHTLELYQNESITDSGIECVTGVCHLTIVLCPRITDLAIAPLLVKNLKYIHLYCSKATEKGLKALTGIPEIHLPFSKSVTDDVLYVLSGVHTINLTSCERITDDGVKALAGVHSINLRGCDSITDESISALCGVHTINLSWCQKITGECMKYLSGVHTVSLAGCKGIIGANMKYLSKAHSINLSYTAVTDDWLGPLANVYHIELKQFK